MTNIKEYSAIERKQTLLRKVIRNHASHICRENHVPTNDNNLCMILGCMDAQNNEDAIARWLHSEYPIDPADITPDLLNEIESSFIRLVRSYESA